ncbi:CPBP family intramembrane glutamic endopeptidase [Haloferax namakaokahaiae]|uniref:CPBP family intramembrane glutamic endopeptidase n=1 Tax=Haloferax namakaokahaiae TaxID=1748331 RepID=A0ABD5ZC20_9EURY
MESTKNLLGSAWSLLAGLLLGVGGLIFGSVLVLAAQLVAVGVGFELTPLATITLSLILLQGIAFGGVALAYSTVRGLDFDYFGIRLPTFRDLIAAVLGYVTAIGVLIVSAIVVTALSVEPGSNQVSEIATQDPNVLLLLIPASFLLIGPGEELLFRGVVQNRIRESFGVVPGIALASAIFAAIHYVALTGGAGGRLITITILFFPSVVFGTAYELTDNLAIPALIHGAYNATLFSLAYIAFRFMEMNPNGTPAGLLF